MVRNLLLGCAIASVTPHLSAQSRAQSPAPSPADENAKAAAIAQRLAKFQMAWGPELNSPGATMQLREISREKVKGQTLVTYRILTTGLPKNSTYNLMTAGFDYVAVSSLDGVTLDDSGQAICAGTEGSCGTREKPNDLPNGPPNGPPDGPIDLKVSAATGEPKRFGLVSHDHLAKAFLSVVPFPASTTDRGCSLDATLLTPKAEALLIQGSGFQPNSEVRVQANSAGETHFTTEKTDGKGTFIEVQLPYVEGKSNGTIRVTVQTKTCAPSLDFQWGKDSYKMR